MLNQLWSQPHMKIVTDNGIDIDPRYLEGLEVTVVPLTIRLDNQDYRGGIDISGQAFYERVRASKDFPTTSAPAQGEFAEVYKQIAQTDPDIISIHISAKLSATYNSARLGAELAQQESGANITVVDSGSVSGIEGWMVEAAAKAAKAGWPRERILKLLTNIRAHADTLFVPETLKYLVHGGRVSGAQGIAAGLLNIKPILKIDHKEGTLGRVTAVRSSKKAVKHMVEIIEMQYKRGASLRVQIEYSDALDMVMYADELLRSTFDCHMMPTTTITPLVGAHLGPGAIAVVYAPNNLFDELR
ncbi:MAG: DegV family protein [Phototrophicaceae bacterium]